ncbi:CRISPR-associated protein Csx3 [Scytonema sp. UIC 10036]|uniref:CRISPR-associated protein Csx3 n=1 Tax=Scytonema sp. UIC 10036 TaxID=2304196 RepID=UPI00325BAFDE
MIDSGEITGGHRLLIDGAQSVAVGYTIAHKLAHLYEVIAVLDPKLGSKINTNTGSLRYKNYIVTISHGTSYKVGDVIETQEKQQERNIIKVVLCGPPHSGKSCLREGLKQAILGTLYAPYPSIYPYVITACPDGEGSWYQKTYEQNQELAKDNKPCLKSELTPEFAEQASKWVTSANQLINIIDIGGKITPENEKIIAPATHAVILAADTNDFADWEKCCQKLNLKIVAKIHSILHATQDEVFLLEEWKLNTDKLLETAPLLTGSIHRLERGEDLSTRPMIKALAEVLIHLTRC